MVVHTYKNGLKPLNKFKPFHINCKQAILQTLRKANNARDQKNYFHILVILLSARPSLIRHYVWGIFDVIYLLQVNLCRSVSDSCCSVLKWRYLYISVNLGVIFSFSVETLTISKCGLE